MAGIDSVVTVRLADMPEALAGLRREMAFVLRAHADTEPSAYVRERMHAAAAAFEAGQKAGGVCRAD